MFSPVVNKNFSVKWEKPFLIVDNFLENIDEFSTQLLQSGGFTNASSDRNTPNVGPLHDWRQNFSSSLFPPEFRDAINEFQRTDLGPDVFATNRFYSDTQVDPKRSRAAFYPHTDFSSKRSHIPIVFNLWLHDGEGGTAFYNCDGYYSNLAMPEEMRFFIENYVDDQSEKIDLQSDRVEWNSDFQGNDIWQLWYMAKMKKNRAYIYCGDLWHKVYIPKGEFQYPNARYSMVGFSLGNPDRFLIESDSLRYLEGQG